MKQKIIITEEKNSENKADLSNSALTAAILATIMFAIIFGLFGFSMNNVNSEISKNVRSYLIPLYFYNFVIANFCIFGILDAMCKDLKGGWLSIISMGAVLFYLYYLCRLSFAL